MTSHDDARAAAVLAALTDWEALLRAAVAPGATATTMVRALSVRDLEQRRRLAKALSSRSGLPYEVCEKMATDPDTRVRAQAASCRHTPRELLERLVADESSIVQRAVASNPNCPADMLMALARHDSETLRRAVLDRLADATSLRQVKVTRSWQALPRANGPAFVLGVPEAVLKVLAEDPSVELRRLLAGRLIPPSVAIVLAKDPEPQVPATLARSLGLDKRTMMALTRSPSPEVRAAVAGRSRLPKAAVRKMAADADPQVRAAVARRHGSDERVFARVHLDPDPEVRAILAANQSLTATMFTRMVRDRSPAVRSGLASNPRAPESILFRLFADPEREVRVAAHRRSRAAAPTDVPMNPIPDLSKITSRSKATEVHAATGFIYWMLDNGVVTDNIFASALKARFPVHVRRAILQHPLAPPELLARASEDSNVRIAEAARMARARREQQMLAS